MYNQVYSPIWTSILKQLTSYGNNVVGLLLIRNYNVYNLGAGKSNMDAMSRSELVSKRL